MDVGFLLFHSYDELHRCVHLPADSEGSSLSCAEETSAHVE